MAAFVMFNHFILGLGKGEHHLHAAGDQVYCYLTNNAPDVDLDVNKADLAGIVEQFGYAAADTANDYTEAAGVGTLTCVDIVWTAAGGSFGPFRYVVIYNETHADDALIAYWDYGSAITVLVGETFTVDFAATTLTITKP